MLSPLIRFGTSTWTYEGWQGQVYQRQYAKTKFKQECLSLPPLEVSARSCRTGSNTVG
jgi:uncharacterized protein YecE (DUF72 family)